MLEGVGSPKGLEKMFTTGMMKAMNCLRLLSLKRDHSILELLVSQWNCESYMFVAAWGVLTATLEDVAR